MKRKLAEAYLVMLLPCLLAASGVWTWIGLERLYHCSDDVPILTAIPPFVHGAEVNDYFIAPGRLVYLVWFGFLAVALLIPAVPILLVTWARRIYSKAGLLRNVG